jgi:hypothetical protein
VNEIELQVKSSSSPDNTREKEQVHTTKTHQSSAQHLPKRILKSYEVHSWLHKALEHLIITRHTVNYVA